MLCTLAKHTIESDHEIAHDFSKFFIERLGIPFVSIIFCFYNIPYSKAVPVSD